MNKDQLHEINSSSTFSSWVNNYNELVKYVKEIPIYPVIENSTGKPVDIPYVTSTSPGIVNIDGTTIKLDNPTGKLLTGSISVDPECVINKFISAGDYTKEMGLPKILIKTPENSLTWGSPEIALRNDVHKALDYTRVVENIKLDKDYYKNEYFYLPENCYVTYNDESKKENVGVTTECLMIYLNGVLLYQKTKAHIDYSEEDYTYDYEQIQGDTEETKGKCISIRLNCDFNIDDIISIVVIKFPNDEHKITFGGQYIRQDYETLTDKTTPLYKTSLGDVIYQLPFSSYNLDTNSLFIYLHGVLLLKDVDYEEYTDSTQNKSYKIKLINKLKKEYENGVLNLPDNLFYIIYPFSFEENCNILLEFKKLYRDYNGIDSFLLPEQLMYRKDLDNLFVYYNGVLLTKNIDYVELTDTTIKFNCYLDKGNYIAFYVFPYEVLKGKYQFLHASKNTYYGVGTNQLYGHVKLTDNVSDGIATTPKYVETYTSDVVSNISVEYDKQYIHRDGGYFNNGLIYTGLSLSATGNQEFTPLEIVTGESIPIMKMAVNSSVMNLKGGYDTNGGANLLLYGTHYPEQGKETNSAGLWKLKCITETDDELYTRTTLLGTNLDDDNKIVTSSCGNLLLQTDVDYINEGKKYTSSYYATIITDKNIVKFSSDIYQKFDDLISGNIQFIKLNALDANIDNSLNVNGDTVLNELDVVGSSIFHSDATFESDVYISGLLDVQKDITTHKNLNVTSNLIVSGSGTISSGLDVLTGDVNISRGDLYVNGNISGTKNLDIDQNATIGGDLNIKGIISSPIIKTNHLYASSSIHTDYITSNTSNGVKLDAKLNVTKELTVAGQTKLEKDLVVSGSATMSSSLNVDGKTELQKELVVNGATTIDNTLTVTASATIKNKLNVNGSAEISSSLDVHSSATFDQEVTFKNNINVLGKANINELDVTGNTVLYKNLNVESGTTTLSIATITSSATIAKLKVNGNANISSLNVTGNSILSTLTVNGDTDFNAETTFNEPSTFMDTVTMNSTLTVIGKIIGNLTGTADYAKRIKVTKAIGSTDNPVYVDAEGNIKPTTNSFGNYLPLSAGINKPLTNTLYLIGNTCGTKNGISIRGDSDDGTNINHELALMADKTGEYGAALFLHGSNAKSTNEDDSHKGSFVLHAKSKTETHVFCGTSDGRLLWDSVEIPLPTGSIIWFAGKTPPPGYLVCNGSYIEISTYKKLYKAIGTLYGSSGSTLFRLPLLTDNRFIEGVDTSYVGGTNPAGLPNIYGYMSNSSDTMDYDWYRGAFNTAAHYDGVTYMDYCVNSRIAGMTKVNLQLYDYGNDFEFTASKGERKLDGTIRNDVYGKSNTVQPKSIKLLPCIKY